jgi:hypothetical protein
MYSHKTNISSSEKVTSVANQTISKKTEDTALLEEPLTDSLQTKALTGIPFSSFAPPDDGQDNTNNSSGISKKLNIQTKLTIGAPDDEYEKEADSLSEQVMRMPENKVIQRVCSTCDKEEAVIHKKPLLQLQSEIGDQPLQTKPWIQKQDNHNSSVSTKNLESHLNQTTGQGNTLPDETRSFMESRFGTDFSGVRIHNNPDSAILNRHLNSQAFTTGNNIYFGNGKYNPDTSGGKQLLAHELTHVVQQKSNCNLLQRQGDDPQKVQEAYEKKMEDIDVNIELAKSLQFFGMRAYWTRVLLLFDYYGSQALSFEELEGAMRDAKEYAWDEQVTLNELGSDYYLYSGVAFPETWSDIYYDMLYLDDTGLSDIRELWEGLFKQAQESSESIPDEIIEKGLPVSYDKLPGLTNYSFYIGMAHLPVEHAIKDFAVSMILYGRSKWRNVFILSWNASVDTIVDKISSGEITVIPLDYLYFLEHYSELLQSFPERVRRLWSEQSFEQFQDDITTIEESFFIANLGAAFGTLLGILFFVGEADQMFKIRYKQAELLLSKLKSEDRVIAAIKWAYYNGYFGSAGEEIWQQIMTHGWQILEMVIVMLLAMVAAHFIPPLGIALDVLLIAAGGIDLIVAIDDLVTRIKAAGKAGNIISLQKESGKLANALIGDGIRIVFDLAAVIGGRASIGKNYERMQAGSSKITSAEAVGKAVKETSEGQELLGQTTKISKYLRVHTGDRAATEALRIAGGDADMATRLLEVGKQATKIHPIPSKITIPAKFASMTIDELRHAALADPEAVFALINRYKTSMTLSDLRGLARGGDQTASYVIDSYFTTSTPDLVGMSLAGDRIAEEVLKTIWPNAGGLRRAISTTTVNRDMATLLTSDLAQIRGGSGVTRIEGSAGVQGGTMAVGRTDIEGLQGRLFKGASAEAGGTAHPRYTPSNPVYPGHAEQNLLGSFADAIHGAGISRTSLQGKTLYIRVEQVVCSSCRAGIFSVVENPGVIRQFSNEFPELIIEITASYSPEVLRIRNGMPVY